jgi:hypothetical protein
LEEVLIDPFLYFYQNKKWKKKTNRIRKLEESGTKEERRKEERRKEERRKEERRKEERRKEEGRKEGRERRCGFSSKQTNKSFLFGLD